VYRTPAGRIEGEGGNLGDVFDQGRSFLKH
jgi:hypothetical protein